MNDNLAIKIQPHWWFLLKHIFITLVVWSLVIFCLIQIPSKYTGKIPFDIYLVLFVLPLFFLFVRIIKRRHTVLEINNLELCLISGIFSRNHTTYLLNRLTDISISQTLLGRILGFGTLKIDLVGDLQPVIVPLVPHPKQIQQIIFDRMNKSSIDIGGSTTT